MAPEETRTISRSPAPGLGQDVHERVHPVGVQSARRGGQRRGADLDDDPARLAHGLPCPCHLAVAPSRRSRRSFARQAIYAKRIEGRSAFQPPDTTTATAPDTAPDRAPDAVPDTAAAPRSAVLRPCDPARGHLCDDTWPAAARHARVVGRPTAVNPAHVPHDPGVTAVPYPRPVGGSGPEFAGPAFRCSARPAAPRSPRSSRRPSWPAPTRCRPWRRSPRTCRCCWPPPPPLAVEGVLYRWQRGCRRCSPRRTRTSPSAMCCATCCWWWACCGSANSTARRSTRHCSPVCCCATRCTAPSRRCPCWCAAPARCPW